VKVFIAAKTPRGDKRREELASLVAEQVKRAGCVPFLAYREIERRGMSDPRAFMPFARQHIRGSDLVIILYDSELRGGLIEEGMAYDCEVPIWLLHQAGERVSNSALGCAERVIEYTSADEIAVQLQMALAAFLQRLAA
jgi:hypothetical protein